MALLRVGLVKTPAIAGGAVGSYPSVVCDGSPNASGHLFTLTPPRAGRCIFCDAFRCPAATAGHPPIKRYSVLRSSDFPSRPDRRDDCTAHDQPACYGNRYRRCIDLEISELKFLFSIDAGIRETISVPICFSRYMPDLKCKFRRVYDRANTIVILL